MSFFVPVDCLGIILFNANAVEVTFAGAFPDRWLPAAICVLPEPWTEQNHFLNSSMKVVRGRVEDAYKAHMEFAYTPEGKNVVNQMNLSSL